MLTTETCRARPSFYDTHLRARRERNLMAQALMRGLAQWSAQRLHALARRSRRLTLRLVNEWYRRRAIRALHQLDDRMLADIGIGRGDIEWVVRCGPPPWRSLQDRPSRKDDAGTAASAERRAA